MSSVSASFKQRASKTLVSVVANSNLYKKAAVLSALAANATKVSDSVWTVKTDAKFKLAMQAIKDAASQTVADAGSSVTDLGQTLIVQVPGEAIEAEFQLVGLDYDGGAVDFKTSVVGYVLTKLTANATSKTAATFPITFLRV
jgi:hypothetical protein